MRFIFFILSLVITSPSFAQFDKSNLFSHVPENEHLLLFIPDEAYGISQELATEVAKFNAKHHLSSKLEIKQYKIPFLSKKPTIHVSGFSSYLKAKEYLNSVEQINPDFFRGKILKHSWIISKDNFISLIKNPDMQAYLDFLQSLE
jgi:hypothetical protein